ncbi:hypothetical protein D4100_14450 [Serratia inhibens]|uniref:Uncharacterized protein n=1 Tax=Serratia inhibens TaxID=2338073 RepID=A0AA92X5X9_9GAMM|nr:hypothetical protein D4100_14450 [Serratia inhibens]
MNGERLGCRGTFATKTGVLLRSLPEKSATECFFRYFTHKAVDGPRPIRFNAARCPDSSVGRAGD